MKRMIALIALGSSASLAQQQPGDGNVPAPDLLDSWILCAGRLPDTVPTPTAVAEGDSRSALDWQIGNGTQEIHSLDDLGFIVQADEGNCGGGPSIVNDESPDAHAVASGYSDVLNRFSAVYGDPRLNDPGEPYTGTAFELRQADDALKRALADDATPEPEIERLQFELAEAESAHDAALAELDAVAQNPGPIYAAGLREWSAKLMLRRHVAIYNGAVGRSTEARHTLDQMPFDRYVPLGNDDLLQTVVIGIGDGSATVTVNQGALGGYVNLNADRAAEADEDGVYDTSRSNFDAAGNLVVPNRLNDGELEALTVSTVVEGARWNLEAYTIALEALRKFQDNNVNVLLQPVIDEAVRRAAAERDHYARQWANTIGDETNRNPVTEDDPATVGNEAAPYSIASRYADYMLAATERVEAEYGLRHSAADREAATQNVIDRFASEASFFEQLVVRREYEKDMYESLAREFPPGDDYDHGYDLLASIAQGALNRARDMRDRYLTMVQDPDNPVVELLDELVKTGGDDGQALVNAVSSNYGAARENKGRLDELLTTAEDGSETGRIVSIEDGLDELFGSDGDGVGLLSHLQDNIDDLAGDGRTTETVKGNADAIAQEVEDRMVADEHTLAAANEAAAEGDANTLAAANEAAMQGDSETLAAARTAAEAGDAALGTRIDTNQGGIKANADKIESLDGRVTKNREDIDTLMEDTNTNTAMISANAGNIGANAGNIAANAGNVSANASNIVANSGRIGRNAGNIAANAGNIGANAGNIAANSAFIGRNAGRIALNSERIGANAAAIGLNSDLIAGNRHLIGELSGDLDAVRAGVAASIALSRMPSIEGGGISFGAGTFAGEMAYAVGFQVQRPFASFDIGVTSSGGEVGAGVGVGLKFWD